MFTYLPSSQKIKKKRRERNPGEVEEETLPCPSSPSISVCIYNTILSR